MAEEVERREGVQVGAGLGVNVCGVLLLALGLGLYLRDIMLVSSPTCLSVTSLPLCLYAPAAPLSSSLPSSTITTCTPLIRPLPTCATVPRRKAVFALFP